MKILLLTFKQANTERAKRAQYSPAFCGKEKYFDVVSSFIKESMAPDFYDKTYRVLDEYTEKKFGIAESMFELCKKIGISNPDFKKLFRQSKVYPEVKGLVKTEGLSKFVYKDMTPSGGKDLILFKMNRDKDPLHLLFSLDRRENISELFSQSSIFGYHKENDSSFNFLRFMLSADDKAVAKSISQLYSIPKKDTFYNYDLSTDLDFFKINKKFSANVLGLKSQAFREALTNGIKLNSGESLNLHGYTVNRFNSDSALEPARYLSISRNYLPDGKNNVGVKCTFNLDTSNVDVLIGKIE